jgi:chloramphenicol 3-O-phosphotransferase
MEVILTAAKLILVTGPAAVGKSTITKALQSTLTRDGELWLAIEIDTFAQALPRRRISWGEHHGRYAERGFVYQRTPSDTIELGLGTDGRRVLEAFHQSVTAVVRSGVSVMCETIVYDDEDWVHWSNSIGDIDARWVKLTAPIAVLEARETEWPPSSRGLARGMVEKRSIGSYDVEVDTSAESTAAIVCRVIASLN